MALIEWNDEIYSVGIRKMDDQHKVLVGLINALHDRRNSDDKEFLNRVLVTLVEYTKKHFADEERLLEKLHWNNLSNHKFQHVQFVKTVSDMRALYEKNSAPPEMIGKLSELLKDWLTRHILVEDKAYQKYLES